LEAEITKWTDWTPPSTADPGLLTPDTTQAATGTVYSIPVGYIAAERRYADTIQTVFIHPAKPFMLGTTYTPIQATFAPTPVHKVSLTSAYLIGQTEVTNAQYARFLTDIGATSKSPALPQALLDTLAKWVPTYPTAATALTASTAISNSGSTWTATAATAQQPIASVSWFGAMAYAAWAGGRLPTEAEWEYAARDTVSYPGNFLNSTPAGAGMKGTGGYAAAGTAVANVKTVDPSSWGLYDMFGNVWEWCFDRFAAASKYPADGQPATNPEGTTDEAIPATTLSVYRGGSYIETNDKLSIGGTRYGNLLNTAAANIGFRIAIPLK
jgi:formylglycine-generating enzyme required for sulfatase activity